MSWIIRQIKKPQDLMWLIITLFTLLIGQWLLSGALKEPEGENFAWLAVIVIFIGALALWIGRSHQSSELEEENSVDAFSSKNHISISTGKLTTTAFRFRAIVIFLAVVLTVWLLWGIPSLKPQDNYALHFLIWITSIFLFLAAVSRPSKSYHIRAWLRQRGWLSLAVGSIVLLAFFLRVWRVGTLPFTLAGDEASQGLEALRVINGDLRNPFTTGWLGVPTMSFFYNSLSIRYFGQTIFALRLPWVIVGTTTVLTAFFLVRQLLTTRMALITAILIATYHYHIHYSRLGSNQVADPLFISLALYALYRGMDRRNLLDWALMGGISGLAFYVYAGARLTPIIILFVLAYLFFLNPRRFWRENHQGIFVGVAAFLIVAAPMLQYAIRYPDDFNARINQVGIIQNGWLAQSSKTFEEPIWRILFDQFQRAALAFNYFPDRTVWYGLQEPLLDPLFGSIFLLGLLYGGLKIFDRRIGPRIVPMIVWWWGAMLLGGMLTESPPSSQRLITLAVPVSFFIAFAMWEILKMAKQAMKWWPTEPVLVIGTILFAFISLTTYFFVHTPQRISGGKNAELATEIAPILNNWKEDNRFYFVGAPWMYWGFATLPYLVPDADAVDILQPLTKPIPSELLTHEKGAIFIIIPPRMTKLNLIEQSFRGGERLDILSPVDNRHMVTLYKVPP